MSAFIVNELTMHRALEAVYALRTRYGRTCDPDDLSTLGRGWFAMNQAAVNARYGTTDEVLPTLAAYRFKFVHHQAEYTRALMVDGYKALSCLQYQCAEGTIPTTGEFQALSRLIAEVADMIVTKMPEYACAAWDGESNAA